MKKSLLLLVTLLFAVTGWAGEIGTPVVTLTQNAEDNTKLDVAITCENARGILFTFNGDEPTLNSPNFEEGYGYQIDLTKVPSPVTVKAVGYDAEYNLGEVGTASFTLDPIEIAFSLHTCWFKESIDVTVTVSGTIGVPRVTYKVNDEPVQNATGEFTFTETSTLKVEVEDDRAGGEVVTAFEKYMLQIGDNGNVTFGNSGASIKINRTVVTGQDNLENWWTITTVFEGHPSFKQELFCSQVGSKDSPAESITFTMTMPEVVKVTDFQAQFGGTTGDTKGKISLMVDNTVVGYDELDGPTTWDVESTQAAIGKTLTITVTDIESGVQVYDISYAYEPILLETLAEALGGEEDFVALSEPLQIVRVADGVAYASNGEDWVALSGLDEPAEGEYVKGVVGAISDLNTLPLIAVNSYVADEESTFNVPITRYNNIGEGFDEVFEDPKPAQVLIVQGYVIDGCLCAYSNGTGNSLKLEGAEVFDEGAYVAAEVAIKKDAVNASGAPRRMNDTGNVFGGYTGVVVGSSTVEGDIPTAVDTVKSGQAVVSVRYFNVAGMESSKPFIGVNIVVTKLANGTVHTAKVVR